MHLLGGRDRMEARLDSFFTLAPRDKAELPLFSTGMLGQYAHGNEPSHHVAYLYNVVGRPEKTQHYVARIVRELYRDNPAGLCGNDDCGQLSAWLVWSAMGFYPADPVSGRHDHHIPRSPRRCRPLARGESPRQWPSPPLHVPPSRPPHLRCSHGMGDEVSTDLYFYILPII